MDTSIPFEAIVPPGIKIPVIESEFPKTRIAVFNPSIYSFILSIKAQRHPKAEPICAPIVVHAIAQGNVEPKVHIAAA